MTGQPKYNTALYLRLSKDDGTMSESSSIQTQKEMLTRYCRENGFAISQIYIDDGWSGTNTNRPSFQRMLSDIEDGKINCVITKTFPASAEITLKRAVLRRFISPNIMCDT